MKHQIGILGTGFQAHYGRYSLRASSARTLVWREYPTNRRHFHKEEYEFNLVLDGSGEYHHRDEVYHLKKGDIFVSEPFVPHEISSMKTKDLHILWLNVYIDTVDVKVSACYEDRLLHGFMLGHQNYLPEQNFLLGYIPILSNSASTASARKLSRQHLVQSLLFDFIELFNITKPDFDNPDMSIDQKPFTILNKASHFIMTNLSRDLSVNDVASSVFTSERNLRHLFRKHMNTTVVDYVNSKKMEHASYLLTLQLQVQEVSEAVGIASPAQFSRLFKRYQGTSPKKFQQNHEPIYT